MAQWSPDPTTVGSKERIGRRLADPLGKERRAGLDGSVKIALKDFVEDREGENLSMDRLGATGIDRSVLRKLTKIADEESGERKPPRSFSGWVSVTRDAIKWPHWVPNVIPNPTQKNGLPYNLWHAEIDLSEVRGSAREAHFASIALHHLFLQKGIFSSPPR